MYFLTMCVFLPQIVKNTKGEVFFFPFCFSFKNKCLTLHKVRLVGFSRKTQNLIRDFLENFLASPQKYPQNPN